MGSAGKEISIDRVGIPQGIVRSGLTFTQGQTPSW
jgi:hypothetical protein